MDFVWEQSEKTVPFGLTALKVTERYNGRLKSRTQGTKKVRAKAGCSALREMHRAPWPSPCHATPQPSYIHG